MRKLADPKMPTEDEVKRHELMGHVIYRNWCPICVRSSGKAWEHKEIKNKSRELPEYHFDYCFPGDEFGYKLTILVGREREGKAFMATTVPTKGASGFFATERCLDFIEECGDENNHIIIRTDQEKSIESLSCADV